MTDHYFTLEEAQETVGWLEDIFQSLAPQRLKAKELYEEIQALQKLERSNGGGEVAQSIATHRRELARATERIEGKLRPVRERGIMVKDIEQGLVDFPHMMDGRVVFLCWIAGESEIRFWHDLTTGLAGRQPL